MKNISWKLLTFHIWVCSSSVVDLYVLCEVVVQFAFFPSRHTVVGPQFVKWTVPLFPTDVHHCSRHRFHEPRGLFLVREVCSFSLFVSPLPAHYLIYSGTVVVLQYLVRLTPFIVFLFCFPSLLVLFVLLQMPCLGLCLGLHKVWTMWWGLAHVLLNSSLDILNLWNASMMIFSEIYIFCLFQRNCF